MTDVTLLTGADTVDPGQAAGALRAGYGLAGELDRLPGEADDNFLLRTPGQERYVVKFAHPLTDPEVIGTQALVLDHLTSTTDLPVPGVVRTLDGQLSTHGAGRVMLVTSYLNGTPMRHVPMTADMRRRLGATLAVLGQALAGFGKAFNSRPRPLLWDIAQLTSLRPLAAELPADLGRDLLTDLVDQFRERTEPRLRTLRTQLVHNDFNVDNILIGHGETTGILDFGDMTVTALANDVAIAACYHLSHGTGPALDLIAGYHAVTPLTEAERDLLPNLILARLTARVIIPRWRALRFPGNQEYILRSTAMAWADLNRLLAVPAAELAERINPETTHA